MTPISIGAHKRIPAGTSPSSLPRDEATVLAHELNNQLAVIIGNADILAAETHAASQDESLSAIRRAAEAAAGLTDRVRILAARSRPQQGPETGIGAATILLLDRDPAQRCLFHDTLRRQGYRVLTAATGHDAADLLAKHPVAVLVADCHPNRLVGDAGEGEVLGAEGGGVFVICTTAPGRDGVTADRHPDLVSGEAMGLSAAALVATVDALVGPAAARGEGVE